MSRMIALSALLAVLALVLRHPLAATAWALLALALWLRDGGAEGAAPAWRMRLGNLVLGAAITVLVLMASNLLA